MSDSTLALNSARVTPYVVCEDVAIAFFAKPKRATVSENPAIGVVQTLIYPGITLELAEGEKQRFFVFSIYTTAPKYATLQGVRVGDPKTKVLSIYGQTREIQESGRTLLVYQIPDTYQSLTFAIFQDKVRTIRCFAYLN